MGIKNKVGDLKCPKCGREMELGYVAGKGTRLRWVDNPKTKTIFAGEKLYIPFTWFNAPSYEALRCNSCGLVLLSYDNPLERNK